MKIDSREESISNERANLQLVIDFQLHKELLIKDVCYRLPIKAGEIVVLRIISSAATKNQNELLATVERRYLVYSLFQRHYNQLPSLFFLGFRVAELHFMPILLFHVIQYYLKPSKIILKTQIGYNYPT